MATINPEPTAPPQPTAPPASPMPAAAPAPAAPAAPAPPIAAVAPSAPVGGQAAKAVNSAVMDAWSANFTLSILIFVLVTAVFIGLTLAIFSFGNIAEIAKNFAKYRCNPLMMPFAGQFGYDAKENFNFCISNILNDKASQIFAPLYGILSQFTGILTVMMNATLGIRKLFSNFFLSVNNFVGNVRNRIQRLLFEIRMSFLKMNNLMGRVFGTMYAVIFMGSSALTTGNNLAQTDLVKFLAEFCFDPATPIQMADGSWKAIKDIAIGDRLAPLLGSGGTSAAVTSTFVFDGARTPVVRIGDVTLSSQHYVEYMGEWIYAADHPSAMPAASVPQLICLNVAGNAFYVGRQGLKARDYDETNDPGITRCVMDLATKALNGTSTIGGPVLDYSLGFDPLFEVKLADGRWVTAGDVELGTRLTGGARVVGLVQESCDEVIKIGDRYVSEAQLVFVNDKWMRAAESAPQYRVHDGGHNLISFVTEGSAPILVRSGDQEYYLRDYREVALPEMEEPYEDFLESAQNSLVLNKDELLCV